MIGETLCFGIGRMVVMAGGGVGGGLSLLVDFPGVEDRYDYF